MRLHPDRFRPSLYETTGDGDHPSIRDVLQLAFGRAADPRTDDSLGSYVDDHFRRLLDMYEDEAIIDCARLIAFHRVDGKRAGEVIFDDPIDGIYVETAIDHYAAELTTPPVRSSDTRRNDGRLGRP